MENNSFNFYNFLEAKGYEKEVIRERSGETFCTNYQKELSPQTWNALTIHKNKTFSAASPSKGLLFKEQKQPESIEEAEAIIAEIEKE
ncbi:hypothetical protein [Chryseobacterium aquaticum]|uniref:Uncharacterized protein n=1 Tax=Chryseobacterium aquaticum subsp. greenlandense TaxID=345663 RepID=A0A101CD39_9FLAO|nr:hypothetical protein [Chryseobacterium aquaticum]KUJ54019.1 hypothetical protein AR686_17685 [Chryseobacterium aquaticum subsp. greenlandense]